MLYFSYSQQQYLKCCILLNRYMGQQQLTQFNPTTLFKNKVIKSELTHEQLELRYSQSNSADFFSFYRSNGFRNSDPMPLPVGQTNLTTLLNKQNQSKISKQQEPKMLKKRVSDPTVYPYSCIGLLIINFNENIVYATGSLIGKNVVFTAASNVYDRATSTHASKIQFVLNINGQKGDVYNIKANPYFHQNYIKEAEGSHRFNYAILEIESKELVKNSETSVIIDQNPGLLFGYLGIHAKFTGKESIFVPGYSTETNSNNQTEFHLRLEKTDKLLCKNGALNYTMECLPSETGSPILVRRNEYYQIVGLHLSGRKELSSGVQFQQSMREAINGWIKQSQGFLNLANCNISFKEIDLLSSLPWYTIAIINLNNNAISDEGLYRLTRRCWPMLRDLNLSQNGITKLEIDPSSIKNLQKLVLSKNTIRDVVSLAQLPLLRVLDLSVNKIDKIDDLLVLKYMQRLDLSSNKIKNIPVEISRLSELKKLYLSKNQLDDLPGDLTRLKSLIVLAIDKNRIKVQINGIITKLQHQNVEVILE